LQTSKYQRNLTFTLYKVLKNALLKKYGGFSLMVCRNLEWVKFMLETVGLDMSQEKFREMAHLFMY